MTLYKAYATVMSTQAAAAFAFVMSSSSSMGSNRSLSPAIVAGFPATQDASVVFSVVDRINGDDDRFRSASPSDRKLLLLDDVDKLIKSATINDDHAINQRILAKIDVDVENDLIWAKESPLPFELTSLDDYSHTTTKTNIIEYEPITSVTAPSSFVETPTTIALRTKSSTPLLTQNEIQLLREAAQTYWDDLESSESNNKGEFSSSKSRFTYQRKGNSEAHLADIVRYYEQNLQKREVSALVDKLLLDRVYPWIRDAFLNKDELESDYPSTLYIYDAIFIRYNATEAESTGAGQPLHRDLGYVSVNIMLNAQEEFIGGGTFFENQLLPVLLKGCATLNPLKPLGPGHAIAHYSSHRHAGSATFEGVRDILVLFVAAAAGRSSGRAPAWEIAARLKSTARSYCGAVDRGDSSISSIDEKLLCRVRHHRLAIEHVPNDGESWHYLGMALFEYHNYQKQQQKESANNDSILRLAISCLDEATIYTPCDGRLQNNLGITLERLFEYNQSNRNRLLDLQGRITAAYDLSIQIHTLCNKMGCDVHVDYESACLNYGLYLSKLDDFAGAIGILSLVVAEDVEQDDDFGDSGPADPSLTVRKRVLRDASNLLGFCKRQCKSY
jgi:hypothetical protein